MDIRDETGQGRPYRIRVAAGGRIVIPAEVRQALGVGEGEDVLLTRDDGGFRITTYRNALARARGLFARLKRPGQSIADELTRERREERATEEREFGKPVGEE